MSFFFPFLSLSNPLPQPQQQQKQKKLFFSSYRRWSPLRRHGLRPRNRRGPRLREYRRRRSDVGDALLDQVLGNLQLLERFAQMLRDGPKVAAVDAALADEALVRLGDGFPQVLPGPAERVAEELDLEKEFFILEKKEGEEEVGRVREEKKKDPAATRKT